MIIEIALGIVLAVVILALLPSIIAIALPIISLLIILAMIWALIVFEQARVFGLIILSFILFAVMLTFMSAAHTKLKSKRKRYFRLLKHLNYWIYWIQCLIGNIGAALLVLLCGASIYRDIFNPDPTLPLLGSIAFPIFLLVCSVILVKYFSLYPTKVLLRFRKMQHPIGSRKGSA